MPLSDCKKSEKKSAAWLLIFLAWLVYASSYLGKVNYSANITQIMDFYGVTKAQAGAVPTFFFFAYGVGQVVNGLFCKRYNIKWMIFGSLAVSAAINLTIALATDFAIIKWLWLANGIVLSILWPTIVRLLSEALPQKVLGKSSVIMGTTVATGTMAIYGLSSIFAAFDNFKLAFFVPAAVVMVVAVVWLLLYDKSVSSATAERAGEAVAEVKSDNAVQSKGGAKGALFATIYVLCFYAVGVNLIKDGLTTWVPAILKEEFLISDSLSILLTLLLPVLAIFGNVCALKLHKLISDYVSHCAAAFAIMALLIGGIIGSLTLRMAACMLVGLVAVNFLASSLNSLITSIFPIFMRDKVNSGLFAGIINGFCYLGSTLSAYGLGVIADGFGWTGVFWVLIAFCAVTLVVWCGYAIFTTAAKRSKLHKPPDYEPTA